MRSWRSVCTTIRVAPYPITALKVLQYTLFAHGRLGMNAKTVRQYAQGAATDECLRTGLHWRDARYLGHERLARLVQRGCERLDRRARRELPKVTAMRRHTLENFVRTLNPHTLEGARLGALTCALYYAVGRAGELIARTAEETRFRATDARVEPPNGPAEEVALTQYESKTRNLGPTVVVRLPRTNTVTCPVLWMLRYRRRRPRATVRAVFSFASMMGAHTYTGSICASCARGCAVPVSLTPVAMARGR